MTKSKVEFKCTECNATSARWVGKCSTCEAWNSYQEMHVGNSKRHEHPQILHTSLDPSRHTNARLSTGIAELDTVLGSGFLEGSITLLSGEPGIGKSTLTLQIADTLKKRVLYVSGEESVSQILDRAKRINLTLKNVMFSEATSLLEIQNIVKEHTPDFLIIDSVQVIYSDEVAGGLGSLSQLRTITETLMHQAKSQNLTTLLIGHVTKDGDIAGPKTLEHLVDTVLLLEGERYQEIRMLRALKNRFGSTGELGLFVMKESGMLELKNPAEHLLESSTRTSPGVCLTLAIEGSRPLLAEVQSLVSRTSFGYPRRTSNGYDLNRLHMICAIIQKYAGIPLYEQDVYVNIIGGLKISDPSVDIAVALAIISSYKQTALPHGSVAFGEMGLSGEIRCPMQKSRREKECEKLHLRPINANTIQDILKLF